MQCIAHFVNPIFIFSDDLNASPSKNSKVFPSPNIENTAICVCSIGVTKNFSTGIVNVLPDYQLFTNCQCFPFYIYETADDSDKTLFKDKGESGYHHRKNITDASLRKFREHYKNNMITTRDIFYYVYGILNSIEYKTRFSSELKKQLS